MRVTFHQAVILDHILSGKCFLFLSRLFCLDIQLYFVTKVSAANCSHLELVQPANWTLHRLDWGVGEPVLSVGVCTISTQALDDREEERGNGGKDRCWNEHQNTGQVSGQTSWALQALTGCWQKNLTKRTKRQSDQTSARIKVINLRLSFSRWWELC